MPPSMDDDDFDRRRSCPVSRSRDYQPRDQPRYRDTRDPGYGYPHPPDEPRDRYNKSIRRRGDVPRSSVAYPSPEAELRESPYRDTKGRDGGRDLYVETTRLPGAFPEDDHPRDSSDERRKRPEDGYDSSRGTLVKYDNYDKYDKYDQREKHDDYDDDYDKYDRYARSSRDAPRSRPIDVAYSYDKYDGQYSSSSKYDDRPGDKYDDGRDHDSRGQKYLPPPQTYSRRYEDDVDSKASDRRSKREHDEDRDDLAYGAVVPPAIDTESQASYGFTSFIPSALSDTGRSSKHTDDEEGHPRIRIDDGNSRAKTRPKSNSLTVQSSGFSRDRSQERQGDRLTPPPALVVNAEPRDGDMPGDSRGAGRDRSPLRPGHRTGLSVDTGRLSAQTLSSAPPSPMLESYHGTYQQSSPMPSPLVIPARSPVLDDLKSLDILSPLNSDGEGSKKLNRRARFHDPEDIASRLAQALKGSHAPKIEPLIEILPSLTHEQVMHLRADYKTIVKTGSDRKGVNIAKHIRSRLKDEEPVLMKACYAVALGQWESEAYWASFWYQGDKTRRELLIESLMGRTNDEIRRIKDAFSDKKYDNSLTKCMKTELKEDKFKKAIMTALEEERMEAYDHHGQYIPIDYKQVDSDVADLRKAIKSERGGETLMISIVVQRSEPHLRAVLREYEHKYRANFAREALNKSGNLVGELLAHILNGVINCPVRDALLLNHALTASRKEPLRRELLTSRLIRFHWDPAHMQDVKRAYRERYGQDLQDAVKEATTGEWGMFCSELCIARMPDHVRRIERVDRGEVVG